MKITPLDIQKHEFPSRRWGGYDPDEVRSFLQLVAEAYEEVARELLALQEELKHVKGELEGHREREKILKNTLLQAQGMVEEIKDRAEKQATLVVKEAEIKAERLLSQAMVKATKVENSIAELKILRNQLRQKLQGTLAMVDNVLKVQAEEEVEDEKLRFLRKDGSSLEDDLLK
jgi:cell division initiation protein